MTALRNKVAVVVAVAVAVAIGYWSGQRSQPHQAATQTAAQGPVVYYRDPAGEPLYSLTPRATPDGQAYVAVHASEDVNFDMAQPEPDSASKPSQMVSGRKIKFYRNPMGLPDTSPTPKKDSMGMDYIAVYDGEDAEGDTVKVSPGKIQRTGVETVVVGRQAMSRTIKAPGSVQLDERRMSVIAPRFDGYVEKVNAVTTGTRVKQGDPLVTVFGQELLDQGARLIIEQGAGANDDAVLGLQNQRRGGVVGARRRLANLGAPEEFVADIRRTRRVPDTVTIRAPRDGVILERAVVDGQAFKAGDVAFRIADTSVVWIMADVAERDIDAVRAGQPATVTVRAFPGRSFTGKVALVYPVLSKETRTARVRIEIANQDLSLLPDMYGDVEIASGGNDDAVAVPGSAVIDSGNRQVVIVELGDGRFEPRDVKLGRRADRFVEILSGVVAGDKVVVNGNFLIDAESNLQAALKSLTSPADGAMPQ